MTTTTKSSTTTLTMMAQNLLQYALLCSLLLSRTANAQLTPGCLFTMQQLVIQEQIKTDFTVQRTYTVCENRVWNIGSHDINNDYIVAQGFSKPFPLRPNLHVKCGGNGARENMCVINGGDVQVDGTNFFGLSDELDLENVILEGFTFTAAERYSVWAVKKGSITFIDCEWRSITGAYAPLYFDYFDPDNRNSYLDVALIGCTFADNIYYGDGAYPAIVVANGDQNRLTIDRSDFFNNDYIFNNTQFARNSYLIEASGELRLTMNCFSNNLVGVSPAASFGGEVKSSLNFGDGGSSNGNKCNFMSRFDTLEQYQDLTPDCGGFEETSVCLAATTSTTPMPSVPPIDQPSQMPSFVPSTGPTTVPSFVPSLLPSMTPPLTTPTTSMPSISDPSDSLPTTIPAATPAPVGLPGAPTPVPIVVSDTSAPVGIPGVQTPSPIAVSDTSAPVGIPGASTPAPIVVSDTSAPVGIPGALTPAPIVVNETPAPIGLPGAPTPAPIVVNETPAPIGLPGAPTPAPTAVIDATSPDLSPADDAGATDSPVGETGRSPPAALESAAVIATRSCTTLVVLTIALIATML